MRPEPGLLLGTSVRLTRPLGEGGMGSVWVAEHLALAAPVAVKLIGGYTAADQPKAAARFRREAAASARLKSPHVVHCFDYDVTSDGTPFIVMELLAGETLGARIARVGALPPRTVVAVVSQTAQVLEEAHGLGLIHRDIKPDNLFLLAGGYEVFVKVLDFGVAKVVTGSDESLTTADGALVGTPAYMSPEQIEIPSEVDYRADLWALAVVAYHALTTELPFAGETVGAIAIRIARGRFRPASEVRPGLPAAVDAWFARALDRDLAARFASAGEMARALEAALAEGTIDPPAPAAPVAAITAGSQTDGATAAGLEASSTSNAVDAAWLGPRAGRVALGVLVALAATAGVLLGRRSPPPSASSTPTAASWAPSGAGSARTFPPVPLLPAPSAIRATADAPTTPVETAAPTGVPPRPSSGPAAAQRPFQPTPPPSPSTRPAPRCDGDGAFLRDDQGNLVPRPECLRR